MSEIALFLTMIFVTQTTMADREYRAIGETIQNLILLIEGCLHNLVFRHIRVKQG